MSAPENDTFLYLRNKLGTDESWVNKSIDSILKPEILLKIANSETIFQLLPKQ